jgi:hypothetical protein
MQEAFTMKRLISHSLLFLSLVYASCIQATPTNFGVIAYWGDDATAYDNTPYGSYMVINPNSGALNMTADEIATYKKIVSTIRSKGGKVIGYIPTGYNYNTTAEKTRFNNITMCAG